ncbi:LuxR C-terminal-related transcriptional regulator [Methylobacterium iners]|uniref:Transcriptional regulatory protein DegU n=1 Tax=Methylobacterium iners TaxID=418707 RepID=A0ABQ4RZ17_9HYPH|nr:response regulator transcription factor [Methylobacterium iners]GJD95851.1 Transcriptional regulatory protein DegU [Methylobacterium iners]
MNQRSLQNRCALVADDDEFFRIAASAILTQRLGFESVIETGSLDEALARLGEMDGAISLALFDLQMPGMADASSVSAVRECFPEVRVAIVSGSAYRINILRALEAGAHGYVPKILGVGELAKAIEIIVSGQIFVPSSLATIPSDGFPSDMLLPQAMRKSVISSKESSGTVEDDAALVSKLTKRQCDVLRLVSVGKSNKEIARLLSLSEGTVKVHIAALLRTLKVANRSAAAVRGAQLLE